MSQTGMKVVARYVDGRLVKGTTYDLQRGRPRFYVFPEPCASDASAIRVMVSDLKAVFFVRDLIGDPRHTERRDFPDGSTAPPSGFRVAVTFRDGEVLVGTTEDLPSSPDGLVVVPVDPRSNNLRVFVVPSAVRSLRPVPVSKGRALSESPSGPPPSPRHRRPQEGGLPATIRTWLTHPATG